MTTRLDHKRAFDLIAAVAHINAIADTHEISIGGHSSGGRASRRNRTIKIRPVKSPVTYAIALHELGHVLGEQRGRRVDKEVQAWEWARAHALCWTRRMHETMRSCLQSYINWAERKQAKSGKVFIQAGSAIYRAAR